MNRPRYRDEIAILKHIEDTKALAHKKLAESEQCRKDAAAWYKVGETFNGNAALDKSKKLGKAATNLLEKKLPKLGVKLAQMRTDIMPFLPDRSIVR